MGRVGRGGCLGAVGCTGRGLTVVVAVAVVRRRGRMVEVP